MSTRSPQTRLQKRLVSSRHFLLSGLEDAEKKELAVKISGLGGVYLESETFKPACTHLVCGRLSRSEKFLCACAMGRWILHPKYITDSAERGAWLQEEDYEWVNYPQGAPPEFMNASRRCRFNVEAFQALPFSGWRVAVVVRGCRKSSIYSRLLSCGGAEVYRLTLPVGNRSRVADLLTYVFVGERNIPDVHHLIEYGIMCLRPEFIGDYILQDPPPDPLDYLVKLETSQRSIELGAVDLNSSTTDIQFSQSSFTQSPHCSQSLTSSQSNTPWGSNQSSPQGTPLKAVQYKSVKPVPVSPLVLTDLSQTLDSPSSVSEPTQISVSEPTQISVSEPTQISVSEPTQIILKDSSRKRKMMDNLDKVVCQIKRRKMTHRGDLWQPSVFTGLSAEENQEPVEIVLPFPASLEGMILACFEEDSSNPDFFLAGLDIVVSSISNRQFPSAKIIKVILHRMLGGTKSFQTDLIQYRCYDVLMKILNLHPPTTPSAIDLYQAVLDDKDDRTDMYDQRNIIRSFLQARSESDGPSFPKGRVLLLRFIVAALEVNLQHHLDRIDKGEIETRKLRGCMFAQTLWPGSTLMSFNSTCKEFVILFGLSITDDMDSLLKRDVVKLTTSLICMAVLIVQYVETGRRVALHESIALIPTAASLLHEATRQIPSTLDVQLMRTVLRNLTPPWVAVNLCCVLLRKNFDDYLLLHEPAEDIDLQEIVTKFFFLLPKINSRENKALQRPHQKVNQRLPEGPRLRTAGGKENLSRVGVNKRNVKGETPLQVACIRNNLKKVKELLGLADVDINTSDYAGWTPLHEACNHGHLEIVKELLNFVPAKTVDQFFSPGNRKHKKVNLLAVTKDLITPLHDAVMNNRLDVCKLLLQHGGPALLECKTAMNQTPLDLAPTSQMRELLLSFSEARSSRSFSQESFSSDCLADSPPSDYLYEQVLGLGEEDHGFADREECAKYIAVISTLVHAYLKVIDYNQIQAILEGKSTLSVKGVKTKQNAGQDIIQKRMENSSPQCKVYSSSSNQSTPTKSRSCADTLLVQRDFRTACKLSTYVERFSGHLQRITREEDFASLRFDLCMLSQTAASCQMSLK